MRIESANENGKSQDFEINIASIIDCFVVLILYLLLSASYISLGVFDVNVPTLVAFEERTPEESIDVQIDLDAAKNVHIRVTGAANDKVVFAAKNETWDFEALQGYLQELKGRWPSMAGVVLSAERTVIYTEIIRMIDAIRKVVPGVALGDREQV